jgi:hypothetical protein
LEKLKCSQAWWYRSIIPATQEVGGSQSEPGHGEKYEFLFEKFKKKKRAGGVVQVVKHQLASERP